MSENVRMLAPKIEDAVTQFNTALDQKMSSIMLNAILTGWPYASCKWKKYPCSEGGRLDLVCDGVRLAKIRVTFDPPSIKHEWVAPTREPAAEQGTT